MWNSLSTCFINVFQKSFHFHEKKSATSVPVILFATHTHVCKLYTNIHFLKNPLKVEIVSISEGVNYEDEIKITDGVVFTKKFHISGFRNGFNGKFNKLCIVDETMSTT